MKKLLLTTVVLISLSSFAQQKREAAHRTTGKPAVSEKPVKSEKLPVDEQSPVVEKTAASEQLPAAELPYITAIGGKLSGGLAFSYKQFITPKAAIEAQAMFFKEGVRFIGLYEFHFPLEGVKNLSWYVGPGAHVGVYRSKYKTINDSNTDLGIDGVVGLDYKIPNQPINISLDWQPSFSLLGSSGLQPQFGGLAVRYVIK